MTLYKSLPLAGLALCCFFTISAKLPTLDIDDIVWTKEVSIEQVEKQAQETPQFAVLPPEIKLPDWLNEKAKADSTLTQTTDSFKIIDDSIVFAEDDSPMIAIVIDDMGLSLSKSEAVVDLPAPLTLAYLPYGKDLPAQTQNATEKGHELMVHMPMEPLSKSTFPGPKALLTAQDEEELLANLKHNLSQFEGYVGINNHMGSALSQDADAMEVIMTALEGTDLFYLDSRTTAKSMGEITAKEHDIMASSRDVFLDHEETDAFVAHSLALLEEKALENGSAIAIGHPKKVTVSALEKWIPQAKAKGFRIVPVSEVIASRQDGTQSAKAKQHVASAEDATTETQAE